MAPNDNLPAQVPLDSQLVGVSPWMRRVRAQIRRIAAHDSNVLIIGPSGTGKEIIARAVHTLGTRAEHPFIAVDCAAIMGTLFASQLFGHLPGAFTGANSAAMGCFRAAEGGTIFLDEIGELEYELQAKLLRVLQERTVVPLGSHHEIPVNVRVLAATNRELSHEVNANRFREDLYYRLNVVSLQTLPLRERPEDIGPLAAHILAKLAVRRGLTSKALSRAALEAAEGYAWPGNVRELENVLENAVLMSEEDVIGPETLGVRNSQPPGHTNVAVAEFTEEGPGGDRWRTMDEVEREHIRQTLEHTYYNQSAAARLLEMDRNLLRRKMRKHGIDSGRSRRGRPRGV